MKYLRSNFFSRGGTSGLPGWCFPGMRSKSGFLKKKSSHIRCDFSSSRQLEPTLFNTSLGFTAAVTGKLIIWKINDHIEEFSVTESTKDLFVSGIFGPLACSFLIASALQEPSSESRQFWSQTWKKLLSQFFFFKYLCL